MFGAHPFGSAYFGEIGEGTHSPGTGIFDIDERFGVAAFGWSYLGGLTGIFQPPHITPTPPIDVDVSEGGTTADSELVTGGSFVPVTRPKRKRKKPEEKRFTAPVEPLFPEEERTLAEIQEAFSAAEKWKTISTDQETKDTKKERFLFPRIAPVQYKDYGFKPVYGIQREIFNKKLALRRAEDLILLGIDEDGEFSLKVVEDVALL